MSVCVCGVMFMYVHVCTNVHVLSCFFLVQCTCTCTCSVLIEFIHVWALNSKCGLFLKSLDCFKPGQMTFEMGSIAVVWRYNLYMYMYMYAMGFK